MIWDLCAPLNAISYSVVRVVLTFSPFWTFLLLPFVHLFIAPISNGNRKIKIMLFFGILSWTVIATHKNSTAKTQILLFLRLQWQQMLMTSESNKSQSKKKCQPCQKGVNDYARFGAANASTPMKTISAINDTDQTDKMRLLWKQYADSSWFFWLNQVNGYVRWEMFFPRRRKEKSFNYPILFNNCTIHVRLILPGRESYDIIHYRQERKTIIIIVLHWAKDQREHHAEKPFVTPRLCSFIKPIIAFIMYSSFHSNKYEILRSISIHWQFIGGEKWK